MNKKLSDTTEKIDNEMMIKLLCIAACGGAIYEGDIKKHLFLQGFKIQGAIDKGFLQEVRMKNADVCDTLYEITPVFWGKIKQEINPKQNTQLDYFFQIKTAKAKKK